MAGDESDSDLKPSSVAIIREVYDSENAHIKFEMELERALEAGVRVIVIEPEPLGEETARWIYVGNLLHKISVYSGLCSIASECNNLVTFYNNLTPLLPNKSISPSSDNMPKVGICQ
ncbi:hypothetical protein evm_007234 [Chilo suppressalis]|nr:hypothetical protein evm_007234 [Chilo suppressalis]